MISVDIQKVTQSFEGVYRFQIDGHWYLATTNLTPGITFYGEQTYEHEGVEYRSWNPTRSKLSAAIMKGLQSLPIRAGSMVLYLGVASGTTCSHVSDIVTDSGHTWAVDFAPRSLRDFLDKVANHRENVSPILGDARNPNQYGALIPKVNIIYSDVAQPDQADIVVRNAKLFLKEKGWIMLSVKARSIDVKKNPKEIYASQEKILIEAGFEVSEVLELEPYEKDHAMIIAQWS